MGTDPCVFSEMKIYPGHGMKFASKDGKTHFLISSKVRSLYHQKIKPVKLTWTQAWRRLNKKVRIETSRRRRKNLMLSVKNKLPPRVRRQIPAQLSRKLPKRSPRTLRNDPAYTLKALKSIS